MQGEVSMCAVLWMDVKLASCLPELVGHEISHGALHKESASRRRQSEQIMNSCSNLQGTLHHQHSCTTRKWCYSQPSATQLCHQKIMLPTALCCIIKKIGFWKRWLHDFIETSRCWWLKDVWEKSVFLKYYYYFRRNLKQVFILTILCHFDKNWNFLIDEGIVLTFCLSLIIIMDVHICLIMKQACLVLFWKRASPLFQARQVQPYP